MPQQLPTRASLRRPTRARRSPRLNAVTTGVAAVAAAALAATTVVPAAVPAAQSAAGVTATPDAPGALRARSGTGTATGGGAEVAVVHADPQVAAAAQAAVVQASGALAEAEHLTVEGNAAPAGKIAQIEQSTSVVRELVRRVSTTDVRDAASRDGERAELPDGSGTSAGDVPDTAAQPDVPAVDPAVGAAADAAVSAVAGSETPVDDADAEALATALAQQTAALAQLVDATPAASITVKPAGPTPEEIAAKKAAEEAAARKAAEEAAARRAAEEAARLAALAAEAARYGNGRIPGHLLAPLPWSPHNVLRADAAARLTRLNDAFRAAFGTDLGVTDSYRSYGDQVAVKRKRGFWAARPGYSNHGFGVAVDLGTGVASFGTAQYRWMKEHAPAYGWVHPDWAEPGGRKPEPWHWEFAG